MPTRRAGLVRVEAGITLHRLTRELHVRGLALANLGDIDAQSLAGAHGHRDARHRRAAAQPVGARSRRSSWSPADGEVREPPTAATCCARRASASARSAWSSRSRCAASRRSGSHGRRPPEPLEDVLAALDERADAADHFEFWTFPHSPLALTRTNTRTEAAPAAPAAPRAWVEDMLIDNHVFGRSTASAGASRARSRRINRGASRRPRAASGSTGRFRIFASPRLVRFTEMEYAIPREHAAEAVRGARAILERHPVSFPIELRLVGGRRRAALARAAAATAPTSRCTCSSACRGRRRSARSRR